MAIELAETIFEAEDTGKLYLKGLPEHIHNSYITAYEMVRTQLNKTLNTKDFIEVNGQLEPMDSNIPKRNKMLYEIFRHRRFYKVMLYLHTYTMYYPHLFIDTTNNPGEHYSFSQVVRLSDPWRKGVCPMCGGCVPKATSGYVDEFKRRKKR